MITPCLNRCQEESMKPQKAEFTFEHERTYSVGFHILCLFTILESHQTPWGEPSPGALPALFDIDRNAVLVGNLKSIE